MPIPSTFRAASPGARAEVRRRGRQVLALATAAGLLVALSGCSDDPEQTAVEIAQATVSAKEQAVADAESEATAAAEALLCGELDLHHRPGPLRGRPDPDGTDGR